MGGTVELVRDGLIDWNGDGFDRRIAVIAAMKGDGLGPHGKRCFSGNAHLFNRLPPYGLLMQFDSFASRSTTANGDTTAGSMEPVVADQVPDPSFYDGND
jgi:hypothetical protein